MKTCATCKVEKLEEEFHRKADAADGRHPSCKECRKIASASYRVDNAEVFRAYDRAREQQPERKAAQKKRLKADYEANKSVRLGRMREYVQAHREEVRKHKRAYKARHPSETLAATRKRQAQKLNAVPAWADLGVIDATYAMARAMTELTGIEHHVDHIVPLQHPLVQGLHCEQNLQIIPALENCIKGNRIWPDMPN